MTPPQFRRMAFTGRLPGVVGCLVTGGVLATFACGPGSGASTRVRWPTATPGSKGMDGTRLDALTQELARLGTNAFLVVRDGALVHEWYASDADAHRRPTASLSKSLVGGMALLVMLSDGHLALDDPVATFVPAWEGDSPRSEITLRHVVTHSSGLPHRPRDGAGSGWSERFWSRADPFGAVLEDAPLLFRPGERFHYSGPAYAVLSYVIASHLGSVRAVDLEELLRRRIMRPLGVPDGAWSVGYDRTFRYEGLRLHATWSGASYSPRAIARVGQLMLNRGRWGEEELVDGAWVDAMIRYAGTPLPDDGYGPRHLAPGLGWWVNSTCAWPSAPRDAFVGLGAGGQMLLVVPRLDLVVVRTGAGFASVEWGPELWEVLHDELVTSLLEAVDPGAVSAPPCAADEPWS